MLSRRVNGTPRQRGAGDHRCTVRYEEDLKVSSPLTQQAEAKSFSKGNCLGIGQKETGRNKVGVKLKDTCW